MNPVKKVILVFVVFLAIGAFFSVQAVEMIRYILPESVSLVAFSPVDIFIAIATVVLVFAAIFTVPVILFEAIKFLKPAMYEKEKKELFKFLPLSLLLFVTGAIFGVYIMAFFGLRFFATLGETYGIENLWSLSSLTESLAMIGIAFGLTFQMPIVMFFLVKHRIVSRKDLAASRGIVLLILLIMAALLTPPDLMSQILMVVPLYALFEGTLFYLRFVKTEKKSKKIEHKAKKEHEAKP